MTHADVQARMPDYLEGGLALDERALFDAHLDGCTSCATDLHELRSTVQLLGSLPEPELPPHLADDVLRRIRTGDVGGGFLEALSVRLREWVAELATPGVAVPATALLAAFAVAVGSGQFQLPEFGAPSQSAGTLTLVASDLPTIPAHAQARLQRILVETPAAAFRGSAAPPLASSPTRVPTATLVLDGSRPAPSARALSPQPSSRLRVVAAAPRNPDDWLAVLMAAPAKFARVQGGLSVAEREHWVRALSRRAVERGLIDEVMATLRETAGPDASALARAFAAEAGLPSAQVASPR